MRQARASPAPNVSNQSFEAGVHMHFIDVRQPVLEYLNWSGDLVPVGVCPSFLWVGLTIPWQILADPGRFLHLLTCCCVLGGVGDVCGGCGASVSLFEGSCFRHFDFSVSFKTAIG